MISETTGIRHDNLKKLVNSAIIILFMLYYVLDAGVMHKFGKVR